MGTLQTYVINLDRSPQRLRTITEQLTFLGIDFQRIPAVDGKQLTAQQLARLNMEAYKSKHGKMPVYGELGCYLSHIAAMQAFMESAADFALILEDDVILTDSINAAMQGLIKHADRWDMVKLSGVHSGTPQPYLEISSGQWLNVMLSRCTGSSAYVINRKAAKIYLAQLLPMELPYDHVFDQGWRFNIKVRLLTPSPCEHDIHTPTTITTAGPSRKFHWSRRLPMLKYRLQNELSRITYGIREIIRERSHK